MRTECFVMLIAGCASSGSESPMGAKAVSEADADTDADTDIEPEPAFVLTFELDLARADGNPLSGFFTSYQWAEPVTDMPESLEYVIVPLADMMIGPDDFSFASGLEPYLLAAEARGNQVVLRPYIDYPSLPSGLPTYLEGQVDQFAYSDFGGGWSPDYTDPALRAAMDAFIAALGDQYDGDPRIGVVQLGLLGFWGEWHTWPHSEWFPDVSIQNDVLHAYHDAFASTLLQVRIPTGDSPSLRIGFHDDSFAYSTVGDVPWFFVPLLEAAEADARWTEVPVGGELRPELQDQVFDASYEEGEFQQDFDACVQATHASFLLNFHAFSGIYDPEEQARARESARMMGYAYHLERAVLEAGTLTLSIENHGVAPFYQPLQVTLSDGHGASVSAEVPPVLPEMPAAVSLDATSLDAPGEGEPWALRLHSDAVLPAAMVRWATVPADGPLRFE